MTGILLTARGEAYTTEKYAQNAIKNKPGYKVVEDGQGGFIGVRKKKDFSGMSVICPGCGLSHHRTTRFYEPDKFAGPAMLELIEPYLSYGWETPPPDPTAGYGCLVCPECGTALAPSGKLVVK